MITKDWRVLALLALLFSGNLFGQTQRELGQLMRNRGEYYFTLNVQDPSEIQNINRLCSVDATDGKNVVCYANQKQYDQLLRAGYHPLLQTPPSMREEAVMWKGGDRATYEWDSYLTYEQYEAMMQGFPTAALDDRSCTLLDLGTLSTGNSRKILGVRLNDGQPDGKPKFLYTSTMHGDEVTGMILMLRLIDEFCTSTDSRITNILDNVDLFIFPNTNPDGTYNGGNNTVTGARRYNGNSIDLNRHFPDFDDGAHPDGETYYQDEAQWMMDLAQEHLFTMGANYHGGAEVINYPWDTYQPLHPDDAWWQYVSLEYAQLAQSVNSSYMTDTESNGITNGYAWYTITGSRQDYMNYYAQCREATIECSSTKTPSASSLPSYWNYNHNAMLTFIEECLNGIHGIVTDSETGQPIEGVSVTVQGHDAQGSSVSTHDIGDFHRPIKGGTYTLKFEKDGYCPTTVDVTVTDGQRVDLEVELEHGNCPQTATYLMQDGDFTTCDALFYDSGGADGTYGNNLDYTMTFHPETEGAKIIVTFTEFNTENTYDHLYVYDGSDTDATLVGDYTGTTSPGTITATNDEGTLTFRFTSDYSLNNSGWVATVSCDMTDVVVTPELHWTAVEDLYANNMTMNAIIQIDGVEQSTDSLEVGVFVGDECRESALPMLFPYNNRYILCLVIAGEDDESFSFRLYDHRTESELTPELTAPDAVTYNQDGLGSPINPYVLNFTSTSAEEQTTSLNSGWNWWSSYITFDENTLNDIQSQLNTTNAFIKSQSDYTSNNSSAWSGSLNSLNNAEMYMFMLGQDASITVSGDIINPSALPIELNPGWNWISYPLSRPLNIATALGNITPTENDMIKSENSFSTYKNGVWQGSLQQLEPGKGYIYLSNHTNSILLVFPN